MRHAILQPPWAHITMPAQRKTFMVAIVFSGIKKPPAKCRGRKYRVTTSVYRLLAQPTSLSTQKISEMRNQAGLISGDTLAL